MERINFYEQSIVQNKNIYKVTYFLYYNLAVA